MSNENLELEAGEAAATESKTEAGREEFALSIRQPWAWLILRPDVTEPAKRAKLAERDEFMKRVENRTWSTKRRGRFWIHVGKQWDCDDDEALCRRLIMREYALELPADLPTGGILGSAVLADCVTEHPSRFFHGPYGFVLEDVRPLVKPVACRGKQGFFKLDARTVAMLPEAG